MPSGGARVPPACALPNGGVVAARGAGRFGVIVAVTEGEGVSFPRQQLVFRFVFASSSAATSPDAAAAAAAAAGAGCNIMEQVNPRIRHGTTRCDNGLERQNGSVPCSYADRSQPAAAGSEAGCCMCSDHPHAYHVIHDAYGHIPIWTLPDQIKGMQRASTAAITEPSRGAVASALARDGERSMHAAYPGITRRRCTMIRVAVPNTQRWRA